MSVEISLTWLNIKFIFFCIALTQVIVIGNYLENTYPKNVIEDADLDTAQLIAKYNYPIETHYATTKDNYIVQIHRIPKPGAPPVFLMHGLIDSSATWIIMGPEKALGYYLSDMGYDVWMGNARGNRYSRNHTELDPDTNAEFWQFSWHEIGIYDLPASIDYVLKETGYRKLGYFGHSQGTTSFWVMCSMHPEYNEKIAIMHALAPVAFMKHLKSPLLPYAKNMAKIPGETIREFLRRTKILWETCFANKMSEDLCVRIYYQVVGKDVEQTNATLFPVIFGHIPAGCNLKQITHYIQLVENDRFCQFDYGSEKNMKHYQQPSPPDYPLEKITAPVALYYTYNDNLSSELDVQRLAKLLPNVIEDCLYPHKKWNHMTMSWGIDARELAHKRMIEIMKEYSYE
ncbi:lipase 1 [Haematobia irritans]|uniref:lipase 1 n=1 Tax=Haematobia irritans TaxID=7368 RepID=UPI003F4FB768